MVKTEMNCFRRTVIQQGFRKMVYATSLILCFLFVPQEDFPESFESKEGRFTAKFPAKPKETKQDIKTAVGSIKTYFFMHETSTGAHAVAYSDYPDGHVKNTGLAVVLKGAREGAAKNIQGEITSFKKITMGMYKGQEVTIVSDRTGLEIMARHFFDGDRMYQVLVAGPKGKVDNEKTKAFFENFKIKGKDKAE